MTEDQCLTELDKAGYCALHRISFADNTRDLGGLHVIGTERHESRRVDNQLRGRSGRQGDPGSSRFYLSLEDDLMAMFASDRVKSILRATGMKEGVALQAKMLTGSISRSQKKVEERNFLIRKNILEYDEVMDHQRHDFYERRQAVIEDKGIRDEMLGCIERSVEDAVQKYLDPGFARERIADWASPTCTARSILTASGCKMPKTCRLGCVRWPRKMLPAKSTRPWANSFPPILIAKRGVWWTWPIGCRKNMPLPSKSPI